MDARFKALSNETRREILLLLAEGPMAAGRLQESLINAVNLQVTLCIDKIG